MVLTTTLTLSPQLNVFVLSMTMTFIILYASVKPIYKQIYVRVLESVTVMNLIILSGGTVYLWESQTSRMTLLKVSIWILFIQFCSIVLHSLIRPWYSAACCWCRQRQGYEIIDENSEDIIDERIEDPEAESLIVVARGTTKVTTY